MPKYYAYADDDPLREQLLEVTYFAHQAYMLHSDEVVGPRRFQVACTQGYLVSLVFVGVNEEIYNLALCTTDESGNIKEIISTEALGVTSQSTALLHYHELYERLLSRFQGETND